MILCVIIGSVPGASCLSVPCIKKQPEKPNYPLFPVLHDRTEQKPATTKQSKPQFGPCRHWFRRSMGRTRGGGQTHQRSGEQLVKKVAEVQTG